MTKLKEKERGELSRERVGCLPKGHVYIMEHKVTFCKAVFLFYKNNGGNCKD